MKAQKSNLGSLSLDTRRMAIIGIRREDSLVFERRAPLTPDHVRDLVKRGHEVRISIFFLWIF